LVDIWEGVLAILLIVIPTGVGAISSKYIVNEWQEKNQKFQLKLAKSKLRKEILKDYQKGLVDHLVEMNNFARLVSDHYVIDEKYVSKDKELKIRREIPKGDENLPKNVLADEFQKYIKKSNEMDNELWNFFTTRNVYFNEKKVISLTQEVFDGIAHTDKLLRFIMNANNTEELRERDKLTHESLDVLNGKIIHFNEMIHKPLLIVF